ncbi:hypothetical protein F5Y17DRAFT_178677 [Xylariaceae sp. FL0594]|nr:hypothetical protein F5Y17DRAFT_178677 [Xylariaceae sp. FL0594]
MASRSTSGQARDSLNGIATEIQRTISKPDIGPLILALTARDADIMGRKLNTMVEEMRAIDDKIKTHPSQDQLSPAVLARIEELEKDVQNSKNILEEIRQKDTPHKTLPVQLDLQLLDVMRRHFTDVAELKQRYKSLVGRYKRGYAKEKTIEASAKRRASRGPFVNRVGKPLAPGRVDPVTADFAHTFQRFNERYRHQKPPSEAGFIKEFLDSVDVHASCALQRRLLTECPPDTVSIIPPSRGSGYGSVFIEPTGLDWPWVKNMLKSRSLKFIRRAVGEKLCGPGPELLSGAGQGVKPVTPDPGTLLEKYHSDSPEKPQGEKKNKALGRQSGGRRTQKKPQAP